MITGHHQMTRLFALHRTQATTTNDLHIVAIVVFLSHQTQRRAIHLHASQPAFMRHLQLLHHVDDLLPGVVTSTELRRQAFDSGHVEMLEILHHHLFGDTHIRYERRPVCEEERRKKKRKKKTTRHGRANSTGSQRKKASTQEEDMYGRREECS